MTRPRAVVLSTVDDTAELEELLYSLGYDVALRAVQHRGRPDPSTFIGSGKVEELQDWLSRHGVRVPAGQRAAGDVLQRAERHGIPGGKDAENAGPRAGAPPGGGAGTGAGGQGAGGQGADAAPGPVTLVAVNAHLKPSQIAALERRFGVDVYDRVRVILEIFQRRAHTKEARLQVELARLRYERPLVREYIHLAKKGEHPGYMAGGEYAVDQYYTTINSRISRIQVDLERIRKEREVRRKHRRRGGFHLVSLAGYANAGKSSLLRRLSGEDVLVENRMFSTLETRTGRARVGQRDVLVTDTVGFVEGLPPELVKAFRSTLEEIAYADCIVLVVDAHDSRAEIARRLGTSFRVLRDFGRVAPVVLALNKADLVPAERRPGVEKVIEELGYGDDGCWLWISAQTGEGIEALVARILAHIPPLHRIEARLPPSSEAESLLGEVYAEAEVLSLDRNASLAVTFEAPEAIAGSLAKRIRALGGEITARAKESPKDADAT